MLQLAEPKLALDTKSSQRLARGVPAKPKVQHIVCVG